MNKKLNKWSLTSMQTILMLTLSALFPCKLWAAIEDRFTIGNLQFIITSKDYKYVSVRGNKNSIDGYGDLSGDLVIPSTVTHNSTEYTVTSISLGAFSRCIGLTSVEIPNTVSTIEAWAFEDCRDLTSIKIPNSVTSIGHTAFSGCTSLTSVEIPNTVTSIGSHAFYECTGLTSFEIPNSVTSIGIFTFYGCTGLTSINIPNSVTIIDDYAFSNCINLTYARIGDSVTSIGKFAFKECYKLSSIDIPNSVTSIGVSAFFMCTDLGAARIGNSVTWIDSWAFFKCINLKDLIVVDGETPIRFDSRTFEESSIENLFMGRNWDFFLGDGPISTDLKKVELGNKVTNLPDYAFSDCTGLTSIEIPNSVTSIGQSAFSGCTGLTSIEIPNSVTSIGQAAFSGCTGLTSIKIQNSVTSIGNYTFYGCTGLTSFEIPNSVTSIGNYTFYGCTGLTSFEIPNSVTSIGESAFYGCTGLTAIDIPSSVTSIGKFAFSCCAGLTSIDIPNSLTSIWSSAFSCCAGLTSINIPNSVTSIGESAFYGCTGLTAINIPNSVTSIGESAFSNCTALTSVIIPKSVTSIGSGAFYRCSGLIKSAYPSSLSSNPFGNGIAIKYPVNDSLLEDGWIWRDDFSIIYFAPLTLKEEYTIPASVTEIGVNAFAKCKFSTINVKSLIPPSITEDSFEGLYDICSLNVPNEGIESYLKSFWSKFKIINGRSAVENGDFKYFPNAANNTAVLMGPARDMSEATILAKVNIDEIIYNVKAIAVNAFKNQKLSKVTFQDGIETIGAYAFSGTSLTELSLTASVKTIGDYAFASNPSLESATIGNGVETIGKYAFYDTSINDMVIPPSVNVIGDYAFSQCQSLKNFTFADGASSIELGKFSDPRTSIQNMHIGRNYTGDLEAFQAIGMTSLELGNTVTEIPESAFLSNSKLRTVKLGSGMTEIPANAFKDCNLMEIAIPSNIRIIGENAFENHMLHNVSIGCGITEIHANAFTNCLGFIVINMTAVEPPMATDDILYASYVDLNVLKDSRESYNNAQYWYQFKGRDLVPITALKILHQPVPSSATSRAADENAVAKQIQFTATTEPANADLRRYIFWESNNPEVATVDHNGLVTLGNKQGEAKITARTLYANVIASATVTPDGDVESGISNIFVDNAHDSPVPNDIYNLQGVCLKRNASQADIDALTPGLYIIAGKKVLVK